MADTTNPYEAPASSPSSGRSCGLLVVGFLIGLTTGCVVVPVVTIGALTALGNAISTKFENVQSAVCKADPNDPACKPR